MADPMWPNVGLHQYSRERAVEERHVDSSPTVIARGGDGLAALALVSQTYLLGDLPLADLIAMLLQVVA